MTVDAKNHFFQLHAAEVQARKLYEERNNLIKAATAAGFTHFSYGHDDVEFDVPEERWGEFMELAIKYLGRAFE